MKVLRRKMSEECVKEGLADLQARYKKGRDGDRDQKKDALLAAYAISTLLKQEGKIVAADSWKKNCSTLALEIGFTDEVDCAVPVVSLGGVLMPHLIHEGVVAAQL